MTVEIGRHCFIWAWASDGDICQRCAHCGYTYLTWASLSDRDIERVAESRENHKNKCPGTPWCAKRGRY